MRQYRSELRELRALVASASKVEVPLVCACRPTGEGGETRAPGLYHDAGGPVVVYAGDGPTAEELARYWPSGPMPLLIGGEADPNLL